MAESALVLPRIQTLGVSQKTSVAVPSSASPSHGTVQARNARHNGRPMHTLSVY